MFFCSCDTSTMKTEERSSLMAKTVISDTITWVPAPTFVPYSSVDYLSKFKSSIGRYVYAYKSLDAYHLPSNMQTGDAICMTFHVIKLKQELPNLFSLSGICLQLVHFHFYYLSLMNLNIYFLLQGTQHLFVGCIRNLKINGRRLEDPPRYYYVSVCEATLS